MKLSTKARYAVMAMVDLASFQNKGPVSLPDIAQRQGLPLPYLEQLFSLLRKQGIVRSVRGAHGGFSLARPDNETCILDIIHAVDLPLKVTRCENEGVEGGCQVKGQRCATHDLWDELGVIMRLFLSNVTLKDVHERKVAGLGRFNLFMPLPITSQVQ